MNYKRNCCKTKDLRDPFYLLKTGHMVAVDWSSRDDEAYVVSMTWLHYGHMGVILNKIRWPNRENIGEMCHH